MAGTRYKYLVGGKSHHFRTRGKNSFVGKGHKKTCHVPGSRVHQVAFPFFSFLSLRKFIFNFTQTSGTGGLKTETLPANLRQRAVVNQRVDPFTDFPSLRCSGCLPGLCNPVLLSTISIYRLKLNLTNSPSNIWYRILGDVYH